MNEFSSSDFNLTYNVLSEFIYSKKTNDFKQLKELLKIKLNQKKYTFIENNGNEKSCYLFPKFTKLNFATKMLDKIIEGCEKLFRRYGIKSLSMDDIARELGMSKKTIYQYVTDKNDLVIKTFSTILDCNKHKCSIFVNEAKDPIEEIMLMTREISQHLKGINSSVFYDLKKYHPEAWEMFNNFTNSFVYEKIRENLEKGIEQGFYRSDLNPDIVSKIYISMIELVTDHDRFSNQDYDFSQVYNEIVRYHFHAICTTKGFKYFNL